MKNKWRPSNWPRHERPYNDDYLIGREAGADAMLDALKKKGVYGRVTGDFECFCMVPPDAEADPHSPDFDRKKCKYPDDIETIGERAVGYLVFIPEGDDDR